MFILPASQSFLVSSPRKVWKSYAEPFTDCLHLRLWANRATFSSNSQPQLSADQIQLSLYNSGDFLSDTTFDFEPITTLIQLSPNFTAFNFHTTFATFHTWSGIQGGKPGAIPHPVPSRRSEAKLRCWWINKCRGWSDVEKSTFSRAGPLPLPVSGSCYHVGLYTCYAVRMPWEQIQTGLQRPCRLIGQVIF